MSFIGNAANEAGKKAAQKAAQKSAQKAASSAAQKGAQSAASKGAEKVSKTTASKAASSAADKGAQSAGKLGDKAQSGAQKKLSEQKAAERTADRTNPLSGAGDPKKALKDPKTPREKTPDQRLEDLKEGQKQEKIGGKKDTANRDASGQKLADKPEGTKSLSEKRKEAKKLADERNREEEQTLGGKAKSVVRDVGGGAVSGAATGAAAGAVAGGVGAAPGAAIGAVKGAATGIVKNKTTRKMLIFAVLSPLIVIAIISSFIVGSVQSMLISSVSVSEGGSDTKDLALASGIKQQTLDNVYGASSTSNYPWTLTLAWQDILKDSTDDNVKTFPATKFSVAMENADPTGKHRNMIYKTTQNPEDKGGGLIIPDDDVTKKAQEETRNAWVEAILAAGTPDGANPEANAPVDAAKNGSNMMVIGDSTAVSAGTVMMQRFPGVLSDSAAGLSMSSAPSVIEKAKGTGGLRPYVVIALGTSAPTQDYLQTVYDAVGPDRGIVFVTGYIKDGSPKPDSATPSPSPSASDGATPTPAATLDNSWVAGSNQAMKDFAAAHSNVKVADWASAVADHQDYLAPDGFSIQSGDGSVLYSNLISEAVNALPMMKIKPGITKAQAEQIYDRAVTLALGVGLKSCVTPATNPVAGNGGDLAEVQQTYVKNTISTAKGMFPGNDAAARQAATIALMTMSVETGFKNYANSNVPFSLSIPHDAVGSDHDSVGLMQQRVSGSWGAAGGSTWSSDPNGVVTRLMTPPFAIGKFIQALAGKDGWETGNKGVLAQDVQVSAFPDRYAEKESEANALISKFWDGSPSTPPDPNLGWFGAPPDPNKPPLLPGSGSACGAAAALGTGTMGVGTLPVPVGVTHISSTYGPRDCSDGISTCFHRGVDLAGSGGTNGDYCVQDIPIYSIANGVVSAVNDPSLGPNNALGIKYSDQLTFYYLHMPPESIKVKVGDSVTAGQQIGLMGSFGQSTGCHIHLETHVNGERIDPLPIIEQGFGVTLPR